MENSGFFPLLKEKADLPDADTETLYDVATYVAWMKRNEKELSFELTEDYLARAEISANRKLYYENGANELLNAIPTYNLMKQLEEFIDIISNEMVWEKAQK